MKLRTDQKWIALVIVVFIGTGSAYWVLKRHVEERRYQEVEQARKARDDEQQRQRDEASKRMKEYIESLRSAAEQGNVPFGPYPWSLGPGQEQKEFRLEMGVEHLFAELQNSLRLAAERGDVGAQNLLSTISGNTAERNRWLRRAAEQGSSEAQFRLAEQLVAQGGSPAASLRWLQRAAEQEHVPALEKLAALYANGEGVRRNHDEAVRLYAKAARRGSSFAKDWLTQWFQTVQPATGVSLRGIDDFVQVVAGPDQPLWKLTYFSRQPAQLIEIPTESGEYLVFLSLGNWLRRIDPQKGIVTGRWWFPAEIVRIADARRLDARGISVTVQDEGDQVFRQDFLLDVDDLAPPDWAASDGFMYFTSRLELTRILVGESADHVSYVDAWQPSLSADEARRVISQLEGMIENDPLAPWFPVALGNLYQEVGDTRADEMFSQAAQIQAAHYSELFLIARFLEHSGHQDAAAVIFERAYAGFLKSNHDPRLVELLNSRSLYSLSRGSLTNDERDYRHEDRHEMMERIYRLAPYAADTQFAWQEYARHFEQAGNAEAARLWRQRAHHAELNSRIPFSRKDSLLILFFASLVAAMLYLGAISDRYLPQRRLDAGKLRSRSWPVRLFSYLCLQYWSRRERIGVIVILMVGWLALGTLGGFVRGMVRVATTPFSATSGNLAGPRTAKFFQERLPPSPQRDLLRALAYQQSGDTEKAEGIYRKLPQFPESWNNLGVLLKNAGKVTQAREAFQQALKLDPDFAEAQLNMGQPPTDLWTELHGKYLPETPMLAPPRQERWARAFFGGPRTTIGLAVAGPFAWLFDLIDGWDVDWARNLFVPLFGLFVAIGIIVAFFIPTWEVTQPPGRLQWIDETFAPGTSPQWRIFGVLVLIAWCYFCCQWILMGLFGTVKPIATSITSNLSVFGLELSQSEFYEIFNPSWIWLYLAPALLFAANFFLVHKDRLLKKKTNDKN